MPVSHDFSHRLMLWYAQNARDLPWRRTTDPYKIWISEIMLQQTTVSAVIPYYERWVKKFPTARHVSQAPLQDILKMWQGLGYYSRARNIHRTAQILQTDFYGHLPDTPEALRQLPGFGPYTVGAVLSIAFDKRHPIIDANVRRVVMRQLALQGVSGVLLDKKILSFLDQVMPQKKNTIFNQALMELGALVCTNRSPQCIACPVQRRCAAYKQGVQELIPPSIKKVPRPLAVAIAVIKKGSRYYLQQRPAKGLLAGLWEFPGGKIEPGENPRQALAREVQEELGVRVSAARHLFNIVHFYTDFRVTLHVFACEVEGKLRTDRAHRWVAVKDFAKYPMPSGSAKIVERLLR